MKFGQNAQQIYFNPTSNIVKVDSSQKELLRQLSRCSDKDKRFIEPIEESKIEDMSPIKVNIRGETDQTEIQSLRLSLQDASVQIKRLPSLGKSFDQS